jgi:hypothetical protein
MTTTAAAGAPLGRSLRQLGWFTSPTKVRCRAILSGPPAHRRPSSRRAPRIDGRVHRNRGNTRRGVRCVRRQPREDLPAPNRRGFRDEGIRGAMLDCLNAIPDYMDLFGNIFPDLGGGDPIDFTMVARDRGLRCRGHRSERAGRKRALEWFPYWTKLERCSSVRPMSCGPAPTESESSLPGGDHCVFSRRSSATR